jgi:DNA adenine methylase
LSSDILPFQNLSSNAVPPAKSSRSQHGPSFLRWAGSKRKSLALLASTYVHNDYQYVEPFAGSAALFFALQPSSAILGDLNGHLVNAMRCVRDDPNAVHLHLMKIPRNEATYYSTRAKFNLLRPYGIRAAVLFIYLNRNCFNGLWRTNLAGNFNVPFGGDEMGGNPPLSLLKSCSAALRRSKLRHQDFRKTIDDAGAKSFIYADPPYFTAEERTFVEYGKRSFGRDDLRDLLRALSRAADRGAHVALTYNDGMPTEEIPNSWSRIGFEVTRNVGGFAGSRKKQREVLFTNVVDRSVLI